MKIDGKQEKISIDLKSAIEYANNHANNCINCPNREKAYEYANVFLANITNETVLKDIDQTGNFVQFHYSGKGEFRSNRGYTITAIAKNFDNPLDGFFKLKFGDKEKDFEDFKLAIKWANQNIKNRIVTSIKKITNDPNKPYAFLDDSTINKLKTDV